MDLAAEPVRTVAADGKMIHPRTVKLYNFHRSAIREDRDCF